MMKRVILICFAILLSSPSFADGIKDLTLLCEGAKKSRLFGWEKISALIAIKNNIYDYKDLAEGDEYSSLYLSAGTVQAEDNYLIFLGGMDALAKIHRKTGIFENLVESKFTSALDVRCKPQAKLF